MKRRALAVGWWQATLVWALCLVLCSGCATNLGGQIGNNNTGGDTTGGGDTNSGSTSAGHSAVEQRAFDLVNARRVQDGATALTPAADLAQVARAYSERMAREGLFDHVDSDGHGPSDRVSGAGIAWTAVGENIALNRGYSDPALVAAQGWFDSPGHYANIMNTNFVESGMGAAQADDGTWYFTQLFLRRP